ncbi:MAG: mechanosensitive ion channel [Gammaproteobacteria bacterium]|nr:mechanosensitive ion channel [Gammaproteobacteria bacterium]
MNDLIARLGAWFDATWQSMSESLGSPLFYSQIGAIIAALILSGLIASVVKHRIRLFREPPADDHMRQFRHAVYQARTLIYPLLAFVTLGVAVELWITIEASSAEPPVLIRIARGLAAIYFFYSLITHIVQNRFAKALLAWVGIPLAILYVFGWLEPIADYLGDHELNFFGISLSLLDISRTLIFGALLFWLGAISNTTGKNVIRTRQNWNPNTRELAAKLFEISLFFVIFVLLMQLLGINLTALAVFGGAVGIGLGFGLQQIASNFISGIIILLDRSVTPGDYIELEDGRTGWLRELNMRHGILETYDGKDIMVPNELFVTSSYTNWTHKDKRQRYSLHFQVAYSTDLDLLFEKVREICRAHPKVIADPALPIDFQPDAEIEGFGESGIDILCEFWMNGIDDGENRVGADLMHSIWNMIQEQGMQIPFPQREVRILNQDSGKQS